MDIVALAYLRDGDNVRHNGTGVRYIISRDGGCIIATATLFLNAHELQTRGWLVKTSEEKFEPVTSAAQVKLGSVLKKNHGTGEIYVISGRPPVAAIASSSRFITSKPEEWTLLPQPKKKKVRVVGE